MRNPEPRNFLSLYHRVHAAPVPPEPDTVQVHQLVLVPHAPPTDDYEGDPDHHNPDPLLFKPVATMMHSMIPRPK